MATIQGTGGNISLVSGFNAKVDGFSFTHNVLTTETTGFGDGGAEVHEPVYTNCQGSCTATVEFDASSTAPLPAAIVDGASFTQAELETSTKGSMTLTATTGCTWQFTGIITASSFSRPEKDKMTVTFSFKGTGQITQTWDETA